MSITDLRREYARARLDEADVSHDPFVEFARWFAEAQEARVPEPTAMTLATATPEGLPSARIVKRSRGPSRSLSNRMREPSGDQSGWESAAASNVTCRMVPVSRSFT